jgi:subtilisin family serine protease
VPADAESPDREPKPADQPSAESAETTETGQRPEPDEPETEPDPEPEPRWEDAARPEPDPAEPEPWRSYELDAEPEEDPRLRERTIDQIRAFSRAYPQIYPGPFTWRTTGIEYLVRRGTILAADERENDVREVIDDLLLPDGDARPELVRRAYVGDQPPPSDAPVGGLVFGVRVLTVEARNLYRALWRINDRLGPGLAAPEHFIHDTSTGAFCQADEPIPVAPGTPPYPAPCAHPGDGAGVRVVVVDTGYDRSASHWWLRNVSGDRDPGIGNALAYQAGHGTFVAGVVRTVAPSAEVRVRRILPHGGAFETDLALALDRVLHTDWPDIITMPAGSYTYDSTGAMCLRRFIERRLPAHKGVALVVAAGNDARRKFFWPAAQASTISVGALAADQRTRAHFTNFGGWVDVYAPGEHLINAFPSGDYQYRLRPRKGQRVTFAGMARWSGTSFSTPAVAGMIAARMTQTGENGTDAAAALLAQARRSALPGVGAVLVPGHDRTA